MPDNDYEPKLLAIFERCAKALEQIAVNTRPTNTEPTVQADPETYAHYAHGTARPTD